ncbi:hypothetical protein D806_012640 [Mycolicibacterium smegmatis MKD8]|uniref:Uncharacterized protein n=2 Tax=Mycolicibacterium smegmatis TaxID=1772 RepID=A0A2U9PKI9_MYCSE|nr:hypothetical protein D806_012640 [Mycolicibacterium smegmatis MKD8]
MCRGILGTVVATQGDGPYDEASFDDFLTECGIQARVVVGDDDEAPPVAIFGSEAWDEDDVDTLWAQTSGENIRVYSQELVLASMAIGSSIFDYHNDLAALIAGHPALERFYYTRPEPEAVAFPAPATTPLAGSQRKLIVNFETGTWPASGALGEMGYRVGRSGLPATLRRSILEGVLQVELVAASPATNAYVRDWGPPNSRRRLQKMVNSIAAFAPETLGGEQGTSPRQ